MKVEIPYGHGTELVDISVPFHILEPEAPEFDGAGDALGRALAGPLDSALLPEFAARHPHMVVVVSDATRPSHTPAVLREIWDVLAGHPDIIFVVAAGTHAPPADKGYVDIFGDLWPGVKDRVVVHDCRDDDNLVLVGTTSRGTEVRLNRLVVDAPALVVINNVKPHYFAGFAGGRKSFLPGVAAFRSIEMNHSHAMSPDAQPMRLDGNPVSEDMQEAADMLGEKPVFSIQTVLTADHRLYGAAAGSLDASFHAAVGMARRLFGVPVEQKADIVVTVNPPPMDEDLYQSQHALENGRLALKSGGVIILVSQCRGGVGSDAFLDHFDMVEKSGNPGELPIDSYRLGMHKATRLTSLKQVAQVWAVTDLDPSIVRAARMKPYQKIAEATGDAIRLFESRETALKIILMPQGGLTVPVLSG